MNKAHNKQKCYRLKWVRKGVEGGGGGMAQAKPGVRAFFIYIYINICTIVTLKGYGNSVPAKAYWNGLFYII